jgi:hypothetical protein
MYFGLKERAHLLEVGWQIMATARLLAVVSEVSEQTP